jgi:signal transduction histidine kinase/DNA-binding response OmpR family regulator
VRTISTSNNRIWVGFQHHGARQYDFNGNLMVHYTYSKNPEYDLKSTSIRKIWKDTQGKVWIGTYMGLFCDLGNELICLDHNDYEGLPHNSIYDIYEDRQGGIWIGTWSGGVAYTHPTDNTFISYKYSEDPLSISDNMVSSFAQAENGDIYVGTELFGLNKFNINSSTFQPIRVKGLMDLLNIKALEFDNNGGLWVASALNGVIYRPKNSTRFIHFPQGEEDGAHVSGKETYSLCRSDSGMWIGNSLGGLNFYNSNTKRISFITNKDIVKPLFTARINNLSIDTKENLWAATLNGLFKIHLPTKRQILFCPSSEGRHKTTCQSFYFTQELSDGNIWIGTEGNGIYIYDQSSDSIQSFDANGLLEGKDVYGIIEGLENDIWITSNDGLILYNPDTKRSRKFEITDGIQGNLFNPNAIFKDKADNLYFGGTNGFSLRKPQPVATNWKAPNILLKRLKVNNTDFIPIQTGIRTFKKIVLKPGKNSLNFYFSADNYLLPEKNKFKYRLTNYADQWFEGGNSGEARFVNVPAGEYTFEVKACNNDGIWNESPATLAIEIQEFWYLSTLAKLLYIITSMLITFLIFRFYIERVAYKKELQLEKIKHEHDENLHEMKLKFFTNVSHEFRTPLTLIVGPVKRLINSGNLSHEEQKLVETVNRNSNRLLQLINQIMDMRKAEKGFARLNISKIEMIDFINQRLAYFSEEARSRNIKLTFDYCSSSFAIEADDEKLDKIIFNLLSNAFKYTPSNGAITVSVQGKNAESNVFFLNQLSFGELDNEDYIEIVILDSGTGIKREDLPHIFERFEQTEDSRNKVNSSGIGLNLCKDFTLMHRGMIIVQSTPGKGSRFSLRLPTRQKAQKILFEKTEISRNFELADIQKETDADNELFLVNKDVKILVVEDNKDLREYIVQLISKNYSVHFAENGVQGLDILNTHNIELVISDIMMPIMDGYQLCQTIKTQIETSHIPVILLTALSSVENTTTGLEKGADAYISKPFDDQLLLSQINNLILQRKRLQENYAKKFINKQPIDVGNLDNYFLNKVNAIIENGINDEKFTIDTMAEEIGLSKSQLYRKLKQMTNYSTSEYIAVVKINLATSLLMSRNYTIDEIAFKTGFNSHSYFSTCFKKIHGQSPKEYLKSFEK